jgi:tryptophan-rich sensory protein
MAEMLLLIGLVILCIRAFFASSRVAAALLMPYLAWLLFAWVLNVSIWMMNGGGLGSLLG